MVDIKQTRAVSSSNAERDPILARHTGTETVVEPLVELNKITLQFGPAGIIKIAGQCLRRTIAVRERVPRRFAAGFAIIGRALFELEIKVRAKQFLNAFCFSPLEGRGIAFENG